MPGLSEYVRAIAKSDQERLLAGNLGIRAHSIRAAPSRGAGRLNIQALKELKRAFHASTREFGSRG
jgi:hypothetical protein